jgi:hypothetical protein
MTAAPPSSTAPEPFAVDVSGDRREDRLGEEDERGAAGRDVPLAVDLERERDG